MEDDEIVARLKGWLFPLHDYWTEATTTKDELKFAWMIDEIHNLIRDISGEDIKVDREGIHIPKQT